MRLYPPLPAWQPPGNHLVLLLSSPLAFEINFQMASFQQDFQPAWWFRYQRVLCSSSLSLTATFPHWQVSINLQFLPLWVARRELSLPAENWMLRELCDWFNRCFLSHSLALSLCLPLTLTQQIQLCPDRVPISLNFCYVMQSGRTKRFGIFHYANRALDWNKGTPISMPERERERGEREKQRVIDLIGKRSAN